MSKSIILIGCGNLGKRYLQAIAPIEEEYRIFIFDIYKQALESTKEFILTNNLILKGLSVIDDFDMLLNNINDDSIVIHCATAKDRITSLEAILKKAPNILFIEKPVTQTQEEFEKLILQSKRVSTKIFVHYALRFQPFCKHLKNILETETNFQFISSLPKMGLVCVGIHQIDLFKWLFNIDEYDFVNSNYFGTYEQKRIGFYDVFGDIQLKTPGNGYATFSNLDVDNSRTIYINTENYIYSIQEDLKTFTIVSKNKKGEIEQVKLDVVFASSYLTDVFRSFLNDNYSDNEELVSLEESYFSHKIIFDYLQKHSIADLNIT